MRLPLLAFVLLFQACQLFGQQAAVSPNARLSDRPAASPFRYPFSLVPGLIPQAAEKQAAPSRQAAGLFFHNWQQLLTPGPRKNEGHRMQFAAGRCVVPLLRVPLPAHYDDGMVRRLNQASVDPSAVWTPPPDCPLKGN
jgi:hypothetical protein